MVFFIFIITPGFCVQTIFKSNAPFIDDSVYNCSFHAYDVTENRQQPVVHKDHVVMAGEFQDETVHRVSIYLGIRNKNCRWKIVLYILRPVAHGRTKCVDARVLFYVRCSTLSFTGAGTRATYINNEVCSYGRHFLINVFLLAR